MATKRARRRNHARDIRTIDGKATSVAWEDRLSAVETIRDLLGDLPAEATVEHVIGVLDRLANDQKWEVRKAAVPALVDTRHPASRGIVERLLEDGNRWVREAAERAKRKLVRITSPADKPDKRLRFAFDTIKDLKVESPEKVYEAAIIIGEKYYEELAADTAHELNTYRTTVGTLLSELEHHLAVRKGPAPEAQEILAKIRERSRYMKTLIEGLVEYAKDEGHDFQLHTLKDIVKDAIDMARGKNRVQLKKLHVEETVTIPDEMAIEACRPHLTQALANVLSNAFESFEDKDGGLEVTAIQKETDSVFLTVKDTGCGMDSTGVEEAKKRFKSLRKDRDGIGLGLPLAIKIVEREHGGRLDIESELDVGTAVTIEIPISRKKES